MRRMTLRAWPVVCALAMSACAGSPGTMTSPSAVAPTATFVNPDGSTVKVGAPANLSPGNSATVSSLRPTLTFSNPAGRFAAAPFRYELEVANANNTVNYSRTIDGGSGVTTHALESDLTFADTYSWRVRVVLGNQVGPWSDRVTFRTPDPPPPPAPPAPTPAPGGGLPFAIPAACRAGDAPGCAFQVAGLSAEWNSCARGNGVGCHRFTRQVAFALAQTDPEWKIIQAAPGGHGCNCFTCGPSDGSYFREDTVVYQGRQVFDMILGAGGPTPSLTWGPVPGPRTGDIPTAAPLCQ